MARESYLQQSVQDPHYDGIAQALHWIMVVLIFTACLIILAHQAPR